MPAPSNPPDATVRNVRASRKRDEKQDEKFAALAEELRDAIKKLDWRLSTLENQPR